MKRAILVCVFLLAGCAPQYRDDGSEITWLDRVGRAGTIWHTATPPTQKVEVEADVKVRQWP